MKWLKRIMIVVGVLLIAIVGIGLVGYFAGPRGSSGPSITVTAGGKKVIATALKTVSQKAGDNSVTVTLDEKHVIFVSADTITVNGKAEPLTANVVKIRSLKDGKLKIEQSSE